MTAANDKALFKALTGVTTATLTTILLKKTLRNVWIRGRSHLPRRLTGSWGALSQCALFPPARIWRRQLPGPLQSRAAPLSNRCRMAVLQWWMLWG